MNLKHVFMACKVVVRDAARLNPQGEVHRGDGTNVSYRELWKALASLESWCFSGNCDVKKVTLCKNCKHYKKYKRKKDKFTKGTYLCALDKKRKDPEHFCSFGEEEEES